MPTIYNIDKMYDRASWKKCRICGRDVWKYELGDLVAIESRITKETNLFHKDCIVKESGCNKSLVFQDHAIVRKKGEPVYAE